MKTHLVASTLEALQRKFNKQIAHDKRQPKPEIDPLTQKPEKSKGEKFLEYYGFSKTFKRNCKKAGYNPFDENGRSLYRKEKNLKK